MKLKNRIISSFTSIFLIIFLIVGVLIYMDTSKTISNFTSNQTKTELNTNSDAISFYLQGLSNEMVTLSQNSIFENGTKEDIVGFLKNSLNERRDRFSLLFYSDLSGKIITSEGKSSDISSRQYFKDVISKGNGYVISRPLISKSTGNAVFVIAAMVKDKNGKNIGVLGNNVLLETISGITSKIKIGDTGYGWICDDIGTLIAHPIKEERMNSTLVTNKEDIMEESEASQIINSESATITGTNKNNENTIISSQKIKNSPNWSLIISVKTKEIDKFANKLALNISLYMILGILVVIIISIFIAGSISKPIVTMEQKFNDLSHGNLKSSVDIKSNDEIGSLAKNFNYFVEKLYIIIESISKLSIEVVESNTLINKSMDNLISGEKSIYYKELDYKIEKGIIQLNNSVSNVLDNVRNQTASSEESLAALEEISSTNENINSNIQSTNKSFNETLEIAELSSKDMEKMTISMQEINSSTDKTNDEIEKLKNLSNDIGSIITSINSIAGQTNLLALNAAIEAARAGEAGRGFSVVADEIRKLAEQTNNETNKIEGLVTAIQSEVDIVKKGSDEIKVKVIDGLRLTELSKNNIQKIIKNNEINAIDIGQITTSVSEQSIASREITTAIGSIADSSTEIESLSMETTNISNDVKDTIIKHQSSLVNLEKLVDKLKEDLTFFKL